MTTKEAKAETRQKARKGEERYMGPGAERLERVVERSLQQRLALFEVEMPQRRLDDLVVPENTQRQIRA